MKYAVNPEGVGALNRLTRTLTDDAAKISKAADSLQSVHEENAASLGPHSSSIARILEDIKQTETQASVPVNELSDRVREIADAYQEVIDNDRIKSGGGNSSSQTSGGGSGSSSGGSGGGGSSVFKGSLRGQTVEVPNVSMVDLTYNKRGTDETKNLRDSFNRTEKKSFLKELGAMDSQILREAGLSDIEIAQVREGRVPDGFQVHHKFPLDDGGGNNHDNFVLIRNEPYHKAITVYQNGKARGLRPGESIRVEWPVPNGNIYTGK